MSTPKIDVTAEPAVIAMLNDVDGIATQLERAGKRHLRDAEKMRDLKAALVAKFRAIKKRMEEHASRK